MIGLNNYNGQCFTTLENKKGLPKNGSPATIFLRFP